MVDSAPHRRGRQDRPADADHEFKGPPDQFQPLLDVPKSIIEKDLIRYMNDDPDYLTKFQHPHLRRQGQRAAAHRHRLEHQRRGQLHASARIRAARTRWAIARSISTTPTIAICTTRRRKRCSARTRASTRRAACASRASTTVANWLLQSNGGWDVPAVEAMFATNENLNVPLKLPDADPHHLRHRLGEPAGHRQLPRRCLSVRRAGPVDLRLTVRWAGAA